MISEEMIKNRIKELESELSRYEELYSLIGTENYLDDMERRKILMKCYKIESQLEVCYFFLGKTYIFKH